MADDKRTAIISINIDNGAAIKRIADLSREIEENKKHVKELKSTLKELDTASNDYAEQVQSINEEIAATNAQTTEYKRTVSDLTRVVANSVRENMENEDSLKSLRAELSRLTNEYDSLGKAQREGVEGAELQKRISAITDEIKGSEEATGRFYRNVGNYENAIKNVLGLNQGFGSSLMGIADSMNFANGIIPGFKGGIVGLNGAMKALSANPVFLTIFGVAKVAEGLKFWADFNKGLAEATRLTEQFTGLSGTELVNYRDEVQAVADVYGKDFKDVMESANALARQFGISHEEAINIVKDGFVSGADVSGQFLDTVKEYPAFFREAGLSASEFVAISTEAVKQGVYSDKGVDAIKEATIRMREMTKATDEALTGIGLSGQEIQQAMADGSMTAFDAIQLVSEKLNELPETSSAVGTAVADIFGGAGEDAGLQYIKTLKDISTDLDEVKGKAGEYAKQQEDLLNSEVELQKATNALFGSSSEQWDSFITKSKTFLNNVLTGLIRGTLEFGNVTGASFAAINTWTSEVIKSFKDMGDILDAVLHLRFTDVSKEWDEWVAKVGDAGKKAGEAYSKSYNETVERNKKAETEAPDTRGVVTPKSLPAATSDTGDIDKVAKAAEKEAQRAMQELEKYEEQLKQIIRDNTGTLIEQINARYDAEIAELNASFEANKQNAEDIEALEAQKNAAIVALNDKRNAEIAEANKAASDAEIQRKAEEYAALQEEEQYKRATKLLQMELDGAAELEMLREQQQILNEEMAMLRQEDFDSIAEYEYRLSELKAQESDLRKDIAKQEVANAKMIGDSTSTLFGAISDLIGATTKDKEEAAKKQKALALAEIAINTGVAIAEGISSAMNVPFPGNLAAIVTTIATVIANIATAINTVNSAKFAEGGLVTGEGTATSDSIPAMLSNGESVMTAQATSMFSPILSAFNQMGGGVPINLSSSNNMAGEEMLARAFARGASSMPSPVVDVQEITQVADRVKVLETLAER